MQFLVERYLSNTEPQMLEEATSRVNAAAEQVSREGMPVRLLRSIFTPADETCFYLYEGCSAEAVEEVARRSSRPSDSAVRAVSVATPESAEDATDSGTPLASRTGGLSAASAPPQRRLGATASHGRNPTRKEHEMEERVNQDKAEAEAEATELADLEVPADDAESVRGGAEPVNDRKSPYA